MKKKAFTGDQSEVTPFSHSSAACTKDFSHAK